MAQFETRIRMKRDTTANWNANPTFVPLDGEIIVYTDYDYKLDEHGNRVNIPAVKIGDGSSYGVDLPFVSDDIRDAVMAHINNESIHTTALEKLFWNNKLNVTDMQEVVENELIFNRN